MLARSPGFICATTVTCVLLVGGDRIADYNELFANAGMPDLTTAQMKDFAQEVKDSSTVDEKQVLNTLLQERLSWHPEAPDLLSQVLKRSRRLATCFSMKKQADCMGMKQGCSGCMWVNVSSSTQRCDSPTCAKYMDSTSCCANAMKVDEGCFWRETANSRAAQCVKMSCSDVAKYHCSSSSSLNQDCAEAKTACQAQKGCTYHDTIGKCKDSNKECSGDKSSSVCTTKKANVGTCALSTCSQCFTPLGLKVWKEELEGKCKDKCKNVVHCVEEVTCLKGGSSADDKCVQKGSCVAELVFPKMPTTCGESCTDFDKKCQTCGAKTQCGSSEAMSGNVARVAPFTSVAMSCVAAVFLAVKH